MSLKKDLKWAKAENKRMEARFASVNDRKMSLKSSKPFSSISSYDFFYELWKDTYWMLKQAKEKDKKQWLIEELKRQVEKEWQLAKKVYKDIFNLQEKGDK